MRKLIFIFAFAVSAVFADDEKIADIIEKIRPSVVFIESFDRDDNLTAQGSGFFIDSKGSVVTSNYIFEKAYRATAKTSSGKEYPVEGITAKNIGSNVAQILVNIPDSNAPFLSLSTKIPSVGEQIYIVGSSIGSEPNVLSGTVSKMLDIPVIGKIYPISAPFVLSLNGGPAVDGQGNVTGVVTFFLNKKSSAEFAFSTDKLVFEKAEGRRIIPLPENANDAQELFVKNGVAALWNNDWANAAANFQMMTKADPCNADYWLCLGGAYNGLGRWQESLEAYRKAVKIKPDFAEAYFEMGTCYNELGRWQDTIEAYRRAINIRPDYAPAYDSLGIVYGKLDRHEEAMKAFEQAAGLEPDYADTWYNLGLAYSKLGRFHDALKAFERAVKIKPDLAEAYYCLGIACGELGRRRESIEACKQAIKIRPDYANAHFYLGTTYFLMGDRESALEQYRILKTLDVRKANELFIFMHNR